MVFLLARETWVPLGYSQFRVEKWVPEEDLLFRLDEQVRTNGDRPWTIPPYYRLSKLDGTHLMETTDLSHMVEFLQVVLGREEIPDDFFS
ncbi:MAG: hypothetical protein RDU20_19290 [Desulfomonilaceae bacterium]|nr:hypothetical protein [Desulfomonilaceae bacterium]